ncbi:colanic acid biosynthesis glycosyltransferase WcaL [Rothia nasimurium]|uniref:Colanic acid biosynthesis glycosyltransferase WcaL n=1 Tax=Rothia nasimurium TaxID=85336 RepID=A0A1Y1RPT3_9MICC|nr:glycosyltransferase family 4 protein [Rothia nasimurium]ORC18884.1 colanic acid biosynthesis glycosyltransferase WcaL [Rothia nasimurium]
MGHIGYVLKVYPRFSETFVVTEILAREAAGENLSIYALRPTTDTRFHPELARVQAPVTWIPRTSQSASFWEQLGRSLRTEQMRSRFAVILPQLMELPASDVVQGVTLAARAQADGITHLHAHFASLAGRMAWVAHQLTGIPYTVTTHAKDIFHESVDMTWLRRICGDAAATVAISRYNESYLHRVLEGTGANIVLQYNALELDRFPYQNPPVVSQQEPLRVAAVGRHVTKKGFSQLLDALKITVDRGLDVQLTLGGSGELTPSLVQQIQELELGDRVTLPGPLTQQEVRDLLAQVHVFVAPCIPAADGNMDGLPTVVLEAMACGAPVIATSVTGLPEVVRNLHTGLLLEPLDVAGLADALEAVATSRVNTVALAQEARTLIEEKFDSRAQARALGELQAAHSTKGVK